MCLSVATIKQWSIKPFDVDTAFLDAELPAEAGDVVMRPPQIMIDLGLVPAGQLWRARKGLYGLRIAPRAWAAKRDRMLRESRFKYMGKECKLLQSMADPSIWIVVHAVEPKLEVDRQALGIVLTYVDDIMTIGPAPLLPLLERLLRAQWSLTEQDLIDARHPGTITYIGQEIQYLASGKIRIHQTTYVTDMLKKWGLDACNGSPSIVVDQVPREELDGDKDLQDIRMAQKLTGGLIWVSSKSRADIAFAVSRMGSHATLAPLWTLRLGKKVLRYLKATLHHALEFAPHTDLGCPEKFSIVTYADASFEVDFAQSGMMTLIEGNVVDWASSKQAQVARSTAEAEVTALATGNLRQEALQVVMESMAIQTKVPELYGDNTASISVMAGEGSWRTRALANRASALRQRSQAGLVLLRHVPTGEMYPDVLTKSFTGNGMVRVRQQLGMMATTR